jgi:hypothetical protein
MRTILMGLFMLLFAVSAQASGTPPCGHASMALAGTPVLTLKSRAVVDRQDVFTISVSFVDASVLRALDGIKSLNRPGSYIAYEFLSFDVDATAKQIKVTTTAGTADERQLLAYLQKSLETSLTAK